MAKLENTSQGSEVTEEQEVNNSPEQISGEIIDLEWEEIQEIFALREQLNSMEAQFSRITLSYEKTKLNLISNINQAEIFIYERAKSLREHKNIDSSVSYELKLPNNPEEKGYFLRRE